MGWTVRDGDGDLNHTIPASGPDWNGVLEAGSYLVFHIGGTSDTPGEDIYADLPSGVLDDDNGSVSLLWVDEMGIDFVRYDECVDEPPTGTFWTGVNPDAPVQGQSLGRDKDGTDTDDGSDWESTGGIDSDAPTPGMRNAVPIGDVSQNGAISAYDASLVLQHVVGSIVLSSAQRIVAEVSGNGVVTAYDASLILRYVIGDIARFPVEEEQMAKMVYMVRRVWMGEVEELSGGGMRVPVLIDEMGGVVSGELVMSFSGDVGDVAVHTSELTSEYLLAHNVQDGRIRVSFAGTESNAGSGTLVEVVFDRSDDDALSLERVSLNEGRIPVRMGMEEVVKMETPVAYRLDPNYPNPFNPETTIRYAVAQVGMVRVYIYGLTGQVVRTLVDGERAAGRYSVIWDGTDDAGRDVGSGVYLCRMVAGSYRRCRKLVMMK